jgi:hypothetical protein
MRSIIIYPKTRSEQEGRHCLCFFHCPIVQPQDTGALLGLMGVSNCVGRVLFGNTPTQPDPIPPPPRTINTYPYIPLLFTQGRGGGRGGDQPVRSLELGNSSQEGSKIPRLIVSPVYKLY